MLRNADRCNDLADRADNETVSTSLRELAEWYRAKAAQLMSMQPE